MNSAYLLLDALDDVTTVPTLATGGEPSVTVAKLLRGECELSVVMSDSALPLLPETKQECL